MPLTPTELQVIAAAEAAKVTHLSLHTGNPGTTGANEATGGSPAYARKAATASASGGIVTSTQVTFDVPAGTYSHFGLWAGATFLGGNPLSASQTPSAQSQIALTATLPLTAT